MFSVQKMIFFQLSGEGGGTHNLGQKVHFMIALIFFKCTS